MKRVILLLVLFLVGCAGAPEETPVVNEFIMLDNAGDSATVNLTGVNNYTTSGFVVFTATDVGMEFKAELFNLTDNGNAVHIHEFGDCGNESMNAGGHFNPENKSHGAPGTEESHVGDLENIWADTNGYATHFTRYTHLTFTGDHSIIGKALIIHSEPDSYNPDSTFGDRIACGVITKVETEEETSEESEELSEEV